MAKHVQKQSKFGVLDNLPDTHVHTPTPTYTPTHTHTQQPVPAEITPVVVREPVVEKPVVKERKTRRVQLLLKESSVNALDSYVERYDTSRNEVIQRLIDEFLQTIE